MLRDLGFLFIFIDDELIKQIYTLRIRSIIQVVLCYECVTQYEKSCLLYINLIVRIVYIYIDLYLEWIDCLPAGFKPSRPVTLQLKCLH